MPLELSRAVALVVVDVQPLTLPNARAIPPDELLGRIHSLVDAFRAAGNPVAFALSTGMPAGTTAAGAGGRAWPDELVHVAELNPRHDETIVRRTGWSAFAGTDLDSVLREGGVSGVVLVGLATTFGVESTARAAYDLGYDVVVVSDAVSGPDPAAHEASLSLLMPALGRVATAGEVLDALRD